MYKVKGKPWAYSGAINVSDCATAKEVMLKAGLNFNVAKCELVGKMPIKFSCCKSCHKIIIATDSYGKNSLF